MRKMKKTMTFDLTDIEVGEDLQELKDTGYIPQMESTLADFVEKKVKKVKVTFREV